MFRISVSCVRLSTKIGFHHINCRQPVMTMLPPDPVYIFKGEMLSVSCITFSGRDTAQRIYAGTQSGKVHVLNLKSKREIGSFCAGDSTCLSVCIPQEEDVVVTHTKSGDISFWKEDSCVWTLKKSIKIDFFGFCKCNIFDDVLFAPIKNSKFELISVKTMEPMETIALEGDALGDVMAFKIFYASDRKVAMVAHEGLKLGLWDLKEAKILCSLELEECPMALDFDSGTGRGICGGPTRELMVFSLGKNLEFKVIRRVELTNPGVASVSIRPDGKLVAVGCWDGKLRLYSWKSLVLLAALDIHSATVQDVSFGENHEEATKTKFLLAAGSRDAKISLWDLYN